MHVMIDLETLGINNNCPVISIGAVIFDKDGIKEKFYTNLNVEQQINDGRKVDGGTIKWWMSQKDVAKKVFKEDSVEVDLGLDNFVNFIVGNALKYNSNVKKVKPWGNGSNFDIEIIESLLKHYDKKIPWIYKNVRDLRTFKEFVKYKEPMKKGIAHNALDDAIMQAELVISGMK